MRQVKFVTEYQGHAEGSIAVVDDQLAHDAMTCGAAVPNIDPLEVVAAAEAPETPDAPQLEVTAAAASPENAAATQAPEAK